MAISGDGGVTTVDGDWNGGRGGPVAYSTTSHVTLNAWTPAGGLGDAGTLLGFVHA